tara:strand:- start:413 stop:526 length:114 start_codon:yes stop_codon:yes gene_type:complete
MFGFLHWIALKWARWNYEKPKKKKKVKKRDIYPLFYF